MKQLTALNWVMEQWPILKSQLPNWLIEQTKEMEKEQITGAYLQAKMENLNMPDSMKYYDILEQNKVKAEQHYAKTFFNSGD